MDSIDHNGLDTDVDQLLSDVKELLSGKESPADDMPEEAGEIDVEDLEVSYDEANSEREKAAALERACAEESAEPRPLTAYEQSKAGYQSAKRAEYERERELARIERERRRFEREQEVLSRMEADGKGKKRGRGRQRQTDAEYAQWLYEQGSADEMAHLDEAGEQQSMPAKKGRALHLGRIFGRLVLYVLLSALVLSAVVHFLWAKQPVAAVGLGARRDGTATVLLAGTDAGGFRTDTMMLLSLDRKSGKIGLVSIPRDTLIYCEYSVPKLNSAYAWANGGEKGAEQLMERVEQIIGFAPDGYLITDLDCFEQLVDLMGGVSFDVPMDMHYEDPSQNLFIDLSAGEQVLNGAQAKQLLRFRSAYADADLGRVAVQREFLSAAVNQWISPGGLIHVPAALKLLKENTATDLSTANMVWIAESLLLSDRSQFEMQTMPGQASYISGGSYYVLDPAGVAELVNRVLNPYRKGVAVSDLDIRVG